MVMVVVVVVVMMRMVVLGEGGQEKGVDLIDVC
jgi:hypothetical protein